MSSRPKVRVPKPNEIMPYVGGGRFRWVLWSACLPFGVAVSALACLVFVPVNVASPWARVFARLNRRLLRLVTLPKRLVFYATYSVRRREVRAYQFV